VTAGGVTAGEMGELPLLGITVVALEQAVAGLLASRHLADLGARVIKLERRGEGNTPLCFPEPRVQV